MNALTGSRIFDDVEKPVHRHFLLVRHQKLDVFAAFVFDVVFVFDFALFAVFFDGFGSDIILLNVFFDGSVRRESDGVGIAIWRRRNSHFQAANLFPENENFLLTILILFHLFIVEN
jgi:hypothetical protein